MIQLYRGDDSDFAGLNQIAITIDTDLTLVGFTGCFCFLGVQKALTTEQVAAKTATIAYTSEETSGFTLGQNYGKLTLWDAQGRKAAVSRVLVEVLAHRMCAGTPENEISILIENQYDYDKSRNKPTINGHVVQGDKTGAAYGLNRIPPYSSAAKYAVGDQVMNGTRFYECTTNIPSGEAWTPGHWRSIGGSSDANAVHYTADSGKTDGEKTMARANIGAASEAEVTARVKIADLKAAIGNPRDVKLAPASIKEYLQGVYDAIQALE